MPRFRISWQVDGSAEVDAESLADAEYLAYLRAKDPDDAEINSYAEELIEKGEYNDLGF